MNKLSIGDAGSLLMGAGLASLDDLRIGLSLVGVGALLTIIVAFLQRQGLDVRGGQEG